MAESGLNIATKQGEGEAHVLNLEPFHKTLNEIYQRDIQKQKDYQDQYAKSSMEVAQLSNGIRAVDIPTFTKYANEYKQAKLMSMNPKIKKDPQQFAYWTDKANQSFVGAMSHATQSKSVLQKGNQYDAARLRDKGAGFYEDYDNRRRLYDSTPLEQITSSGMDMPDYFQHPPDRYKEDKYNQDVLGTKMQNITSSPEKLVEGDTTYNISKKYSAPEKLGQIKDEKGNWTGKWDYSQIINDVPKHIKGVYHLQSVKQKEFNETSPEQRIETYKRAKEISNGQFVPVSDDYVNLEVANKIIQAQPKETGEVKKEEVTFQQKQEAAKQKEERQFKRQISLTELKSGLAMSNFYKRIEYNLDDKSAETLGDLVSEAHKSGQTGKMHLIGDDKGVDHDYAIMPLNEGKKKITIPVTTTRVVGLNRITETKQLEADEVRHIDNGDFIAIKYGTDSKGQRTNKIKDQKYLTPEQVALAKASETTPKKGLGTKVKKLLGLGGKDQNKSIKSKDPLGIF